MGESGRWRRLVQEAGRRQPVPVIARTPRAPLRGISDAVVIDCSDGRRYAVKGSQVGRALVADHVVGLLGARIGAPVAEVALVDIPTALITEGSYVAHFAAGVGHGCQYIPDCLDSRDVAFGHEPENKERFALLAVLYGWTLADDRQFLYGKTGSRLVHSVDHGAFLGGSDWTTDTLATSPAAEPDAWITSQADISLKVLQAAIGRLRTVTDEDIAEVAAAPLQSWGLLLDERAALAHHLASRRDGLLARFVPAA